ncbi:ribosome maturation factor RimM [Parerythrobacter lacustris]|uniref:Ribosome maturation factor RimM n=1 Tax=Parerythrobacter lacustris TaxID=2969984 RepID=A0ABT1XVZ3_9SPHN|nr:ribosome maturation factor RimM [Parerythrobacter lacustris]MCR2834602.1 ribosome maturation factor RimM [Parerythrobacter lacustris]
MTHPARPTPDPSRKREGDKTDKPVTLAAVIGAHGVAGEVRLKLFGEGIDALKGHKSFNGGALTLVKIRDDHKGGAVARFAEVTDRGAAEKLRGTTLTIPRDALPPIEDDEYYHADLLGLAVVTDTGNAVGTVADVLNYGASDLIEIEKNDGGRFLVPMTRQAVPEWNADRLVIAEDFAQ